MQTTLNKNTHFFAICQRIFSLALPMAGTQFIGVASDFLCMAMLARLGHEVLAASALIFAIQLSVMVTGMSILFSISVLVGHAYGAKEYHAIGNFLQQGWILAGLIGIPVMILFWHIDSILLFFGLSKQIVVIVRSYFHAFTWAVIPGYLSTCNMQMGYGIHKKMLIVVTSVMSVIVLLISAYALIFGKFGFPNMGVAGLGYATLAQYLSFFIFSISFFYFNKSFKQFELFKFRVHQHTEHFIQMFKIGWPICIQMGGELLSFSVNSIMIGWLGVTALGAFQIINQYFFITIIPLFALSQASGILIGHARGAKQFHEIKKISYASIAITLLVGLIVATIFLLFPKYLASVYINIHNPMYSNTLHLAILLFMIVAITQCFDGLRNTLIGILRGLFDTRFSMVVSLITVWLINIPLGYLLAFPCHMGVVGFLLGWIPGLLFSVIMMGYRLYTHST